MEWAIRFAYPFVLYGLIPVFVAAAWYRFTYYQAPFYLYSATGLLKKAHLTSASYPRGVFSFLRIIVLAGLLLLIARPQLVDTQSKIFIDGIDIMMVLDVSGSMQLFDDPHDQKQRITIAKEEAIKFINKRPDDPIGLVLFGKEALSRCPLTLDKNMLTTLVKDTEIGIVNADGTVLSKGVITALTRLRKSKATSKIIILLTDGEPSPGDLQPEDALFLAKKYGVKIYTIGIGGDYGGLMKDPHFGGIRQVGVPINTRLLEFFAKETGGKFFLAKNQQDLQTIYDTINTLEKTEYETDVYHNYHDIFMPFLWIIAGILILELILVTFLWFGL